MSVVSGAHVKKKAIPKIQNSQEFPVSNDSLQARYIDVTIFGREQRMELIEIINIITHNTLGRYLKVTNCAFLHYNNNDILAVDIRENPEDIEKVTVVITEVFKDDRPCCMGFVINKFKEFCKHVSFLEPDRSGSKAESKGSCISAYLVEE
jgi:hypothetical protein